MKEIVVHTSTKQPILLQNNTYMSCKAIILSLQKVGNELNRLVTAKTSNFNKHFHERQHFSHISRDNN